VTGLFPLGYAVLVHCITCVSLQHTNDCFYHRLLLFQFIFMLYICSFVTRSVFNLFAVHVITQVTYFNIHTPQGAKSDGPIPSTETFEEQTFSHVKN